MRRILFDTNIVLDVLLDRQPHVQASAAVWAAVENGVLKGMLAAHAMTTIHCLVRKELGSVKATRAVSAILSVFEIAAINKTRDPKGFRGSPVRSLAPDAVLPLLSM